MASTSIRAATPGDSRRLVTLMLELGYDSSAETMRKTLERILVGSDHALFVAEDADDGVIGCAHVTLHHTIVARTAAEVAALVVTSGHRRGGVGKALMNACETWAAKRGVREILVRAQQHREAAHVFYVRLGYEVIKEQRVFRRELGGKHELPGVPTIAD